MNLHSKFTRIEKSYKGNHRLRNLKVDEVSLVTEPAILSEEESKAGSGWYVVKSAAGDMQIPEAIAKIFTLREGEELLAARERLANACRLKLVTETKDQQTFWMDPLMVYTDHVVMGYWWYLSLEDVRSERPLYFKCYFSQSEDGEFTIDKVVQIKVEMREDSSDSSSDAESVSRSVEADEEDVDAEASVSEAEKADAKVDKSAETPAAEEVSEAAIETEATPVELQADPEVNTEPAAEVAPEAVEREAPTETAPEEAPAPAPAAEAAEPKMTTAEFIKTLVAAGAAFSVQADGTIQVGQPTAPAPAPAAEVEKNLDAVEELKRDNAKLQDQLRKMKAQPVADLPPVSPAPIAKSAEPASPLDHMLALARRQTQFA